MCETCITQTNEALGRKPRGWNRSGFKMSKEERVKLPGKECTKLKSLMTPEELEAHLLFRRHYERIYRAWRKENDTELEDYQAKYHVIRRINHPEESKDYDKKMYNKHSEVQRSHERRRRARKLTVQSEAYVEKDILDRWGTGCYLCGEEIDLDAPRSMKTFHPRALHLDHVIPIALGGPDTIDNVKPTHSLCNLRRPKGRREKFLASLSPEDKAKLTTFEGEIAERKLGRKLKD